jgi:hypothetical protein
MSSSGAEGNLGRISLTIGITLANAIIECCASRSTTKLYDPAVTLSDDQIRELVGIATTAPTSFNLRNWRFIAVRTPEAKARLRAVAWDQPKITDAAVTFIICRQLVDHSVLPARLASAVEAGIMPAQMVPRCENAARGLHFEQPQRQCDEAVRHRLGGDDLCGPCAGPGFDADNRFRCRSGGLRVCTGRGRSAGHAVVRGAALPENWPQEPRRPVADVLEFA